MKREHVVKALVVGGLMLAVMPAAVAGASSPPTSAGGGGDYCSAHVALEAALNGDDPSAIPPAIDAAKAAAPDEIKDALNTAIELGTSDGPQGPDFEQAYGQVLQWVTDNCGFGTLDVVATEYAYHGVPSDMPAGPTVITLTNEGQEYHEMALFRRNDGIEGADQPAEDILAMPQDLAGALVTPAGAVFAAPGTDGHGVVDLAPGDYIAACFLPVGATQEMMDQMMSEGTEPGAMAGSEPMGSGMTMSSQPMSSQPMSSNMAAGSEPMSSEPMGSDMAAGSEPTGSGAEGGAPDQHWMRGMYVEFTVVGAGTTDTGSGSTSVTGSMSMDTMAMATTATTEAG